MSLCLIGIPADPSMKFFNKGPDDGYAYEDGEYTTIRMTWNDKRRELTIHDRQGNFPEMLNDRVFRVILVGEGTGIGLDNESAGTAVRYTGSAIKVAL